jgi:hypothetical protein
MEDGEMSRASEGMRYQGSEEDREQGEKVPDERVHGILDQLLSGRLAVLEASEEKGRGKTIFDWNDARKDTPFWEAEWVSVKS